MAEPTTTVEEPVSTGADDAILPDVSPALPDNDQGTETAATTATDTPDEGDATASVPEADDKLASFAKGVGIEDLSQLSERELMLLKVAKDNQAEFQRNRQKASELEKVLTTGEQPAPDLSGIPKEVLEHPFVKTLMERVDRIEQTTSTMSLEQQVGNFFSSNPDAKALEDSMTQIVTDRPEIGQLVRSGYLSLGDLYAMAQGSSGAIDAAKADGGREALQKVASKQAARAVPGFATTSAMIVEAGDPVLEAIKKSREGNG